MPIADRLHNVHQRHLLREFFSNNAHSAEYLSASYIAPAASTGGCTAHTDTRVVVVAVSATIRRCTPRTVGGGCDKMKIK